MGGKRWTEAELAAIKDICDSGGYLSRNLHRFPGRTLDALEAYASRNGIETGRKRLWTKEEDEIVRQIWAAPKSIKEGLHQLPGRTYEATKERAMRLKLGRKAPAMLGTRSWIYRRIVGELHKESPLSMSELAERIGVLAKNVQGIVSQLRGKEFYVADWKEIDANHKVMLFALGNKPDAPKPAPKPMAQAHRAYRMRQKIKAGQINPFAILLGQTVAPTGARGRVIKRDMAVHLHDDEEVAA